MQDHILVKSLTSAAAAMRLCVRWPKLVAFAAVVLGLYVMMPSVMARQHFGGKDTMSGYTLSQFGDFVHEWHFVTVRFRKDTGEMRFTYANDLAWDALNKGVTDYPDGAVFAKIGIATGEDPAFTSSIVPSGARRYQLMVRDHAKHKDTDGWGYAIFDADAKTFDEDPQEKVQACAACHRIVPDRGYVFSQKINLEVGGATMEAASLVPEDRLTFETQDMAAQSQKLRKEVPKRYEKIRMLMGDMRTSLFQGTIDEIRPSLVRELRKSGLPTALVNEAGTRFSIVFPDPNHPECTSANGKKGFPYMGVYTVTPKDSDKFPVVSMNYCDGVSE